MRFVRLLSPALVLAGVFAAFPVLAQSSLPNGASALSETYGGWQVACQAAAKPKDGAGSDRTAAPPARTVCALAQVQREQKSKMLVFSAEFHVDGAKPDKLTGVFVLPFGIAVTEPVALSVEGQALSPLKVATCLPVGCIVPAAPVGDDAIAALSGGKALTLATKDTDGRAIDFALRSDGFAEGLKRLRGLAE
jgi:invasion protein IalB